MRYTVLLAVLLSAPGAARAGDLADTLGYLDDTLGEEAVDGFEELDRLPTHEAMAFLTSRDVTPGAPLSAYDCENAAVDGDYTLRTNGNERWSGRECRELRFLQDNLPGYRTMGPRPLREVELEPLLARAEAATDVPAALLEAVIRFESGRRPGLVSDDGRYGLMQLKPGLLAAEGVEATNLLDPAENVMAGARYIRSLTIRLEGLKMAVAAYLDGPAAVRDGVPGDRKTLWFLREVMRLYYASIREFPDEIGAESIAFVWNWLN